MLLAGLAGVGDVIRRGVRTRLLVRMRKHRLCRLQVGSEPVDAVHPGRSLHRLRVLRDQRERIRVVLEVLHQAEHRRDFRCMCGGLHDAVELGGEAGGVENDGSGLAPLHENDQRHDEEGDDDHEKSGDDGRGELVARDEPIGGVHGCRFLRCIAHLNHWMRGDASGYIIALMHSNVNNRRTIIEIS